jgi:hypothetical protein
VPWVEAIEAVAGAANVAGKRLDPVLRGKSA